MGRGMKGYVRKNLIVSTTSVRELQKLLDADSESEAVWIAVEDRLLAEKLGAATDSMAKRGGLQDVFGRGAGRPGKTRA